MAKIVCAAFIKNDKVLLVRRGSHRKWSPRQWDLVGGHVDKGERLDVAIVRECQEEVGLTPRVLNHVAALYEDGDAELKTPFHVYAVRLWQGGVPSLLGTEHPNWGGFRARIFGRSTSHFQRIVRSSKTCWHFKRLHFSARRNPSPLPTYIGL